MKNQTKTTQQIYREESLKALAEADRARKAQLVEKEYYFSPATVVDENKFFDNLEAAQAAGWYSIVDLLADPQGLGSFVERSKLDSHAFYMRMAGKHYGASTTICMRDRLSKQLPPDLQMVNLS